MYASIKICADCCVDNKDGSFTLEIPARLVVTPERELLNELFPDLAEAAYKLLDKQTLLSAVR